MSETEYDAVPTERNEDVYQHALKAFWLSNLGAGLGLYLGKTGDLPWEWYAIGWTILGVAALCVYHWRANDD